MFQLWAGSSSNQVGGISKDGGKWKCNETIGLPDSDWQTGDGWHIELADNPQKKGDILDVAISGDGNIKNKK